MRLKPLVFIAIAFGLMSVSNSLERWGDMAPLAKSGVSPERLQYHLLALLFLLAALGLFAAAGLGAWRAIRDR